MVIRNSILALLATEPSHGYGLKSAFEETTAEIWKLNVGQVYSTLARMERDGLVRRAADEQAGRRKWQITEKGTRSLARWYQAPVEDQGQRDELVLKVLVAIACKADDHREILEIQRTAAMGRLQEFTRRKRQAGAEAELPWLLMLDAMVLRTEAEIRWLDRCEQRLDEAEAEAGR